ncbi:RsfA family transcriptional regulator [Oceanobacillus profundus]|uniref:RsfA family transcriptional regulator n=1 Tax=Oceanobacillus profundus TaxID=372463 RepID=A0A417YJ71_9BACI|nr:RsfA family transcriptional regulator [Oceanobacillus profundus]MBR3118374.1 RsfA family transcriptional regulator [Oceanobacillus sp.]MCM3396943.1 RsfA family transcriptional regulator [Oceanobacillus profundus]PAE30997.1 RsfA family transcriptional regulator [Paenibacillus sp. 7884-2]RHW33069.1 RsfA family transcriptional regulator [Oceanobacillus profundus]
MVKVRQDAWSHEDDLLLAETVLRHIREGSTQLNAFDEVGDHLNRTSAACGFRWNAEVRSKYESAIDLAKRQRKEKKRALNTSTKKTRVPAISLSPVTEVVETNLNTHSIVAAEAPSLNIDMVIQYLRELKKESNASSQSKAVSEALEKENNLLKSKVQELEKQLSSTEDQLVSIQEDYQTFIQIMDRARKMTVLDDKESRTAPAFRMDKNGNLEQLAHGSN